MNGSIQYVEGWAWHCVSCPESGFEKTYEKAEQAQDRHRAVHAPGLIYTGKQNENVRVFV